MKLWELVRSPALWLAALGAALLAGCNLNTSAGFVLFMAGGGCLLLAWIVLVARLSRRESLSPRARRAWRCVKSITLTALAVCLVLFLGIEGLILHGTKDKPGDDARVLIVLGAGIRGTQPSATLQSRLDAALEYLNAHPGCVAVVSGGQGRDEQVSEASVMAAYLKRRGVAGERILLEDRSRNTQENLAFSRAVLAENGLSGPVTVVSSDFHLFRVRRLAARAGFTDIGTLGAPLPFAWLIPGTYVREFGSVVLMFFKELLGGGSRLWIV